MGIFETLDVLTSCAGVSGSEHELKAAVQSLLADCGEIYSDSLGSIFCRIKGEGKHFFLDAHIDRIGLIVKYICSDGFIKADPCGGMDCRTLAGEEVTLLAGDEKLKGVVVSVPPHLGGGGEKNAESTVTIDFGMTFEQAKEKITLGDKVIIEKPLKRLLGERVTAPALDNRAGAAAVIRAVKLLGERGIKANITAAFAAQEEVGCRGAKAAAAVCGADEAIAVDVSFAKSAGLKDEECGALGKGPMIGVSSTLSYEMSEKFLEIAKSKNIPFQTEVMGGRTGTDADVISSAAGGIKTGLLSVPLRYMHSATEVVDLKDIENTALLLADYIEASAQ